MLESLGYRVSHHAGGVHGPDGPDIAALGNHLVLTVNDLPTEDNPGGIWYVDVGLGDALHEALPLVAGVYDQTPFTLTLHATDDGDGAWHLTHDPAGGFTGMSWNLGPPDPERFASQHAWLSTSADSGFVKMGLAQSHDANGVDVVRGLIRMRIGSDPSTSEPILDRQEWFDTLADLFGLRFESSTPEAREHLWRHTLDTHRAWDRAGRP